MPVAFSISVLSRDRKSKAFSSRTADPSNLQPVMHQSKIAVETKCNFVNGHQVSIFKHSLTKKEIICDQ